MWTIIIIHHPSSLGDVFCRITAAYRTSRNIFSLSNINLNGKYQLENPIFPHSKGLEQIFECASGTTLSRIWHKLEFHRTDEFNIFDHLIPQKWKPLLTKLQVQGLSQLIYIILADTMIKYHPFGIISKSHWLKFWTISI